MPQASTTLATLNNKLNIQDIKARETPDITCSPRCHYSIDKLGNFHWSIIARVCTRLNFLQNLTEKINLITKCMHEIKS